MDTEEIYFESSAFEERADYIEEGDLVQWTAKGKHFESVQKKILQIGAKLIVGPRGTGKTHHMRYAQFTCAQNSQKPLAIYVTFNTYLRLETYLHDHSNAIGIFHAWVLAKIAHECCTQHNVSPEKFNCTVEDLAGFISAIEKQAYSDRFTPLVSALSVRSIKELIESALLCSGRKRAIVLFDDAALTLTNDYMVEFFDIFRSIKSSKISPKAAVYPGTTQYGPRFHVDQDAEKVPAWLSLVEGEYVEFMETIVDYRFQEKINLDDTLKRLLMFCSFGIPRAYITFLRAASEMSELNRQILFNRLIESKASNLIEEYKSIAQKIPQYKSFIHFGNDVLDAIISELKSSNYNENDLQKKHLVIGITDIDDKADRVFKFLIEAGLLFEFDPVSHGENRKLRRFIPHVSLLMHQKAIIKSRGFNAENFLSVFSNKSKHPLRRKFNKLVSQDKIDNLTLDLPPCTKCGTARISAGQKFCHICGTELLEGSIYKACLSKSLDELPLTEFQKRVINETVYRTVQDVISADNTAAELKKVDRVGVKRAEKIIDKINAWINEFLY